MKKILGLFLLFILLSTSGCATIMGQSEYAVCFKSNKPNAKMVIKDPHSDAVLSAGTLPMVVSLKSASGFLAGANYVCETTAPGCDKQIQLVHSKVNYWVIGNFIFGGLVGVLIDGATGAIYKLEDNVFVNFPEKADSFITK